MSIIGDPRGIVGPALQGGVGVPGGGAGGGSSAIKSVEFVSVGLTDSELEATKNLTKGQDPTKCVMWGQMGQWQWTSTSDEFTEEMAGGFIFDNAGTAAVKFRRGSHTFGHTFSTYVVEFNDDVSVQAVEFDNAANTGSPIDNTITAVDLDKTFLIGYIGLYETTDDSCRGYFRYLETSTTNVRLARDGSPAQLGTSGTINGTIWVVTDTSGNHFDVQRNSHSVASTLQDNDYTITTIDPDVSNFFYTMSSQDTGAARYNSAAEGQLLDGSTVRITRRSSGSPGSAITVSYYVVTWKDGTTVQRGFFEETTAASNTTSNTDVALTTSPDSTKSVCHFTQNQHYGLAAVGTQSGNQEHVEIQANIAIGGSQDIRIQHRSGSTVNTSSGHYEVTQFPSVG